MTNNGYYVDNIDSETEVFYQEDDQQTMHKRNSRQNKKRDFLSHEKVKKGNSGGD